jgi:hypothetical protein
VSDLFQNEGAVTKARAAELGPKWIEFRQLPRPEKRKTDIWKVLPKSDEYALPLGEVRWYSQWRRYAFYPGPGRPVFEPTCLRDIASFCEDETRKRKT